jgi:DNA-binding protein HU-beta
VNKLDLIGAVADETELSQAKAAEVVDAVLGAIEAALKRRDEVRLVGFGTFAAPQREAGIRRNQRTDEAMRLPATFEFVKEDDVIPNGDRHADIPSSSRAARSPSSETGAVTEIVQRPARSEDPIRTVGATAATRAAGSLPSAPAKATLRVLDRWHIADPSGAVILGSSEPDFIAQLRSGASGLATRDMQDRARLLLDIYEGVFSLLRDPKAEQDCIRMQREDLAGASLLDLMTEGSQRNLIRAQAFVDYANGR